MEKIHDRIILGLVTGVVSGIPGRLLNAWQYQRGLTDWKYGQMAASLFLPRNKINTPEGRLAGSITNHINISITGIMITYLLSATGRDKAIVKGCAVTSLAWLGMYGLASRLNLTLPTKKPYAPVLSFIDHLSLGALCGFIAPAIGDSSLFPDYGAPETGNEETKLPLVGRSLPTYQTKRMRQKRVDC